MRSIFFYGLFMDESLLREKGVDPSKPIRAFIEGYGLRIGERATLIKAKGERAHGLIMSLSNDELDILYGDKSVADYVPEKAAAITEGKETIDVIAYNLPLEKLTGQNITYAESLAALAEEVGLPPEYVNEIKGWIS